MDPDRLHTYIQNAHADRVSAGLMMYRRRDGKLDIFLVHPGGPYFRGKDIGFWGIPKGLIEIGEDAFTAALREFKEETGILPAGGFIPLGEITQRSGKKVYAWAFEGDWDPATGITSNEIEVEWPPRSGRTITIPEVDRAAFFPVHEARLRVNAPQRELIDRLEQKLASPGPGETHDSA